MEIEEKWFHHYVDVSLNQQINLLSLDSHAKSHFPSYSTCYLLATERRKTCTTWAFLFACECYATNWNLRPAMKGLCCDLARIQADSVSTNSSWLRDRIFFSCTWTQQITLPSRSIFGQKLAIQGKYAHCTAHICFLVRAPCATWRHWIKSETWAERSTARWNFAAPQTFPAVAN
jgi:hypothetical protein